MAAVGGLTLPTYWHAAYAHDGVHQCGDGKDNDGNGSVDTKDSGCIDKWDNDESGGGARGGNSANSGAEASNANTNTSANENQNTSESNSQATATSSSSSSACLVLCNGLF